MAKHLVQIIIMGTQVVVKAFTRALRQEIAASQAAAHKTGGGARGTQHVAANYKTGISLEEALQILNVERVNEVEAIERNYKHLMEVNDRSKGGSFYIQSKAILQKFNVLYIKYESEEGYMEGTDNLKVAFKSVKLIRELGTGQFGKVYLGQLDDKKQYFSCCKKMSQQNRYIQTILKTQQEFYKKKMK